MKKEILNLLLFMILLVLAGCATIRSDYKAAREINTVESCEEFLAKHPDSEYEQKEGNSRYKNLRKKYESKIN